MLEVLEMLETLTLNELLSNIGYICESGKALKTIKYATSSSIKNSDLPKILPILIRYRDELVARISSSDTVLERSALTQMYYRLLSTIRNLNNYLTYLNDDYEMTKLSSSIMVELKTSSSQIENVALADSQLNYTED